MYEVQVLVRGPEGVMATSGFRTTKAGAEELVKRSGSKVVIAELLAGIPEDKPEEKQTK